MIGASARGPLPAIGSLQLGDIAILPPQHLLVSCREDIAELCVALLSESGALDTTFEIKSTVPFSQPFTVEGPPVKRDWSALLIAANLQAGVTGKTINGKYTGRQAEAEAEKELVAAA